MDNVFVIMDLKEKIVRRVRDVMIIATNMEIVLEENVFVNLDGVEKTAKIKSVLMDVLDMVFVRTGDVLAIKAGKDQIVILSNVINPV